MKLLAVDPGTTQSGLVVISTDPFKVICSAVVENANIKSYMEHVDEAAIEMIASYGMPVGREVFETCVWIGRLLEQWENTHKHKNKKAQLIFRREVKLHICGSPRAKDSNVRQALLDKLGAQGTKENPGPLYGIKSHSWAALGVGITALHL